MGQGWNPVGQLGDGTTVDRPTSVAVVGLPNAVAVAGGIYHSLALDRIGGSVWAWGWNGVGQLGDGTTTDRLTPVKVAGLTNVVMIAAGAYHSLAVKSDGTVWAWGWNGLGQLGDGTTAEHHVPVQVTGLNGVVSAAGGAYHSLALKGDGTVWSWGWNGVGQLGDGTTVDRHVPVQVLGLTGVFDIAAGYHHNIATNGTVHAWGWNATGQLGDGTTVDRAVPVPVLGLGPTPVNHVAAGAYHSMAVGAGHAWAWGWNGVGQLGDGTTIERHAPVSVGPVSFGVDHVADAAAGAFHSVLLRDDGAVDAFGWNVAGQLGDGTTTDRHTPVRVLAIRPAQRITTIAAGAHHTLLS